jgi:hypothetical protein
MEGCEPLQEDFLGKRRLFHPERQDHKKRQPSVIARIFDLPARRSV